MFSMITNLAKAAVAVVATPVYLAVDVITLPASSLVDSNRGPFDRTAECLKTASDDLKAAIKPQD